MSFRALSISLLLHFFVANYVGDCYHCVQFSARLYKEEIVGFPDDVEAEVPVMRECKMDETMADVGTSEGSMFEIVLSGDSATA